MPLAHKLANLTASIVDNPFFVMSAGWRGYARLRLHLAANRYANLLRLIVKRRCRTFLEMGTNTGANAERMIRAARLVHGTDPVSYFGFDLFEDCTDETIESELSLKPWPEERVRERLERTGAKISLFRGDSRVTLPGALPVIAKHPPDLIFIDGGHSVETIRSDWNHLLPLVGPGTTVLFDDYYLRPDPDLRQFGSNDVVDAIDPMGFDVCKLVPSDQYAKNFGMLEIIFCEVRLK
jgi:hypothetical protein